MEKEILLFVFLGIWICYVHIRINLTDKRLKEGVKQLKKSTRGCDEFHKIINETFKE